MTAGAPLRALFFAGLGLMSIVAGGLYGVREAAADSPRDGYRYPYDPVCSWGRVANGKGMIVRCLTRDEAASLGSGAPARSASTAGRPSAAASASSAPAAPAGALAIDVGPLVADTGQLPLALGKLKLPTDRYLECIQKNGGLSRSSGAIKVRFLVRERGRAEGTVVTERSGVSEAAARCVAEVVDRRFVGHPDAPMVGATLTVKVRESTP